MKSIYSFLILFIISYYSFYGQDKDMSFRIMETDSVTSFCFDHSNWVAHYVEAANPVTRYRIDLETTIKESGNRDTNKEPLFPEYTLNLLFSEKIGTVFSSSSDLSFDRAYFNLDASDKSFSIGYNFDNRKGDPLKQLNWIFSAGAKIKSKDGFAAIADGGDLLENNIGINLKASFVGNGTITWGTQANRETIERYRSFMFYRYNEKVKKYNEKQAPVEAEKEKVLEGVTEGTKALEKTLVSQSDAMYEDMLREELTLIDDKNLFTSLSNYWFTGELYLPVGDAEYDIVPYGSTNQSTKANYYAFDASLAFNMYYERPAWASFFVIIQGGAKGQSNVSVNGWEAEEFQSIVVTDGGPMLTTPFSAIKMPELHERFVTPYLKCEAAIFYKNKFGFSPAIEKNFGSYDGVNWKLGIPVSLKPAKEGGNRVNFEVQWKEMTTMEGSNHYVGFSTSFLVGSLVK